jgi:hypothetical protein
MTPRMRNRIGLILILALFAAPLITAYVLNAYGWRPAGTRNYGELIEPAQDLTAARFVLADGKTLAWKDEDWSWTIFAITGPGCARQCLARIDELRRARLTLNQNAFRVRVVVLDDNIPASALAELKPVMSARDADVKLANLRPSRSDEVAVAFADPHGFLVLRYPVGYDGNKLRKDLERVIKS